MSLILDTLPFPPMRPCSGPLVWFFSAPLWCREHGEYHPGAVLECSGCDALFTTGGYLDRAHLDTPVMRSPR